MKKKRRFIYNHIVIFKDNETADESPLVEIIERKRRKDW
jgi:hypothetical protein